MTNKRLIQTSSARKVIGPTVGPSLRHSGLEHTRIFKGSEPCQIQGSPYKKATIYSGGRNPVLTITYRPELKSIGLFVSVQWVILSTYISKGANPQKMKQYWINWAGTEILQQLHFSGVLLKREMCSRSTQGSSP